MRSLWQPTSSRFFGIGFNLPQQMSQLIMNHSSPDSTQRRTLASRCLRFFGSVKLAMALLAVLILSCVVGTVIESRLDAAVAQAYFYDAPWFSAWLLLLCVNLVLAVVVRYPWKRQQAGFIITHAGIVILLAGAWIGRRWGVEGTMTLFKGEAPANVLVLDQMFLEIRSGRTQKPVVKQLAGPARPPTPRRPVTFKAGSARISVRQYARELGSRTTVDASPGEGSPAVRLVLQSAMLPKPVEQWLVLGDSGQNSIDFGPASVHLVADREQPGAANNSLAPATAGVRERHFVFANFPEMSIARALSGSATGIRARFQPRTANAQGRGRLELNLPGRQIEFDVDAVLDRAVLLAGTPWQLQNVKYLADFRLQDQEPVSASDQPKNPALVFEIANVTDADGAPGGAPECNHPKDQCTEHEGACCAKKTASTPGSSQGIDTGLILYHRGGDRLRYASFSKGACVAQGNVVPGVTVRAGWGDWSFRIEEILSAAVVRRKLGPLSAETPRPLGRPGIFVELEKDGQRAGRWVSLGEPESLKIVGEDVTLRFGRRLHALPFAVALDRFEVERNEGTESPAGFKSQVRFIDPAGQGAQSSREIWMNHPATFPESWGMDWLGRGYRFSQASWNPDNLNQTTLQVLRDPGWALKWSGSLLVCAGLFSMFYLRPQPAAKRKSPL
jgi:hypothetical protein